MDPSTRYAKSAEVNIAYQVVGEGPIDLVLVWGWTSHLEAAWDDPDIAELLSRLASFSRLLLFDKRGTGMSDRVPEASLPTLEQRMDDVRAVMDAARSERAALLGISEGGPMSMMFAATYPDRTTALVLCGAWVTWVKQPDYPWALTVEQHEKAMQMMQAHDPSKPFNLEHFAPSKANDEEFGKRFARYGRLSASPGAALALYRMNIQIDVRPILPSIHIPTLVLQRSGDRITYAQAGRYIGEHIPGAKYVELPGNDHVVWVGDREAIVGEIEEFLTGIRHAPETDRVLATIVFTDIVDSTARATALGDKAWKDLLARHDAAIRRQIVRFRGREVKTQGDSFVITFDGPARAVRCAQAIIDDVQRLGLAVRIGMHAGEITILDKDIGGIAVHIAARVGAMAGANETLVSSTVKDLVAGSGITFEDRGVHELKGLPETWRIYAVARA